jgi:type VI secretion system protein ImpM
MTTRDWIPGFYGKLPVVGDFVSRRLSRDFISPWDQWLQSSMAASREQLGQQWLNNYLTSPLWRFVLSPGVAGNSGWMGILMPSVDRVGRYFPLTLALAVPKNAHVPALFTSNNDWYASLESAALIALDDNLDLNDFENLLKQIKPPLIESVLDSQMASYADSGKRAFYFETSAVKSAEDALLKLNSALLEIVMAENGLLTGQTLWGTLGSERMNPFVLISQGLPPVHAFSGFMAGDLSDRGWNLEKKVIDCQQICDGNSLLMNSMASNGHQDGKTLTQDTPLQQASQWQSFSRTDLGMRRKCNEDAILDKPEAGIWAVADGMGGHQAGDIASTMIINALDQLILSTVMDEAVLQVQQCLKQVNDDLRDLAESHFNHQIVGSTIVVMLANGQHLAYLWAGDSRLYQLRDGRLRQLTIDHTDSDYDDVIESTQSGSSLKSSNVITRAVGADDALLLDFETIEIRQGDIYLLSSDGLDKEVSGDEIEKILIDNDCKTSVESLIDLTLERNARDNVSVIVVEMLSRNNRIE